MTTTTGLNADGAHSERQRGHVAVELCIDDLDGALVAERSGADRVELCANLGEGGTTPSIGLLRTVLESTDRIGVQVIVRPRGGDFVYDTGELEVMCEDVRAIATTAEGAPTRVGVVVGALTADGRVDRQAMERLISAAAPLPVTFHKAFDVASDLFAAYDVLRELGVERVLTSGGPYPALDGLSTLAELVRRSRDGGPVILIGGSVRPANVLDILAGTSADEVHLRAQAPSKRADGTLQTDQGIVSELMSVLDRADRAAAR